MLIAYVVASGGVPPPKKGRNTSGGLKEKEGAGIKGGAAEDHHHAHCVCCSNRWAPTPREGGQEAPGILRGIEEVKQNARAGRTITMSIAYVVASGGPPPTLKKGQNT